MICWTPRVVFKPHCDCRLGFKQTYRPILLSRSSRKEMANSMGSLSRRLCRSVLSNPKPSSQFLSSMSFCTTGTGHLSSPEAASDSELDLVPPLPEQSSPSQDFDPQPQRIVYDRPLENGLDVGIYKVRSFTLYHCICIRFSLSLLLLLILHIHFSFGYRGFCRLVDFRF